MPCCYSRKLLQLWLITRAKVGLLERTLSSWTEVSFFCVGQFIPQASLPLYGFFVDTLVLASLQGVFLGYFSVLCRSCLRIENLTEQPSEGLHLYMVPHSTSSSSTFKFSFGLYSVTCSPKFILQVLGYLAQGPQQFQAGALN